MNLISIIPPRSRSYFWPFELEMTTDYSLMGKKLSEWKKLLSNYARSGVNATTYEDVWLSLEDMRDLAEKDLLLEDDEGNHLGWSRDVLSEEKILSKAKSKTSSESFILQYPWQLLEIQHQILRNLTDILPGKRLETEKEAAVFVGKATEILKGVVFEGDVVIGENCKIGPNCYLRGPLIIGNGCRIGQGAEVKNSIIGNQSKIPHLSYIGDSLIGDFVNVGAGCITANVPHENKTIRSEVQKGNQFILVDTKRRKFGSVIGNKAKLGVGTLILPGRKLGENTRTLPQALVQKDLRSRN